MASNLLLLLLGCVLSCCRQAGASTQHDNSGTPTPAKQNQHETHQLKQVCQRCVEACPCPLSPEYVPRGAPAVQAEHSQPLLAVLRRGGAADAGGAAADDAVVHGIALFSLSALWGCERVVVEWLECEFRGQWKQVVCLWSGEEGLLGSFHARRLR